MEEKLSTMEPTLSTMAQTQQNERRPHYLDAENRSPLEDMQSSSSTSQTSTQSRRDRKLHEQADKIRQLKNQLQEINAICVNT
jgi:hypothetical protein